MTLSFDFMRAVVMTHTHRQKFKVDGQSVQKIEWKQTATDGRTDEHKDGDDCINSLANAVGRNMIKSNKINGMNLRNNT